MIASAVSTSDALSVTAILRAPRGRRHRPEGMIRLRTSRPEDRRMEPVAPRARGCRGALADGGRDRRRDCPDRAHARRHSARARNGCSRRSRALLLVAVIAADPGSITRRSRELRVLSIGLVSVLVIGALWSTVLLIDDLDPRRPGDELGRRPARGRLDRVGVEQHRVRTALLGARRRRSGGARAPRTGAPGPRVPAAPEPGHRRRRAGDRGSSTTSTSASPTRPRSARPT